MTNSPGPRGIDASIRLRSQALVTDVADTFDGNDMFKVVGYEMTREAARQVYEDSGVDPLDIPVVELHDCFATNELITYEGLGLTPPRAQRRSSCLPATTPMAAAWSPTLPVVSCRKDILSAPPVWPSAPSSCGSCAARPGDRQVDGAKLALQHNIGLGGAAVVSLYEKVS